MQIRSHYVLLLVLIFSSTGFAKNTTIKLNEQCAIPANQLKIEGLLLGESKQSLLQRFPLLAKSDEPDRTLFFSPNPASLNMSNRIASVSNISYNKNNQIDGWYLSIGNRTKGKVDVTTSPEKLKNELVARYHLPNVGWKKHIVEQDVVEYHYTCRDYRITVYQDYGTAIQQGSGATLSVDSPVR